MKLSMIFDALASGELHNLYLSEDATSIREDKKEIVLRAINLGLNDLYHRFTLKVKTKEIETKTDKLDYSITDPEFIEIIHLHWLDSELLVNHDYYQKDVRTFVIDKALSDNQIIQVVYKAKHRHLTQDDIVNNTDIELPMAYLNALLYFIASRAYTSIVNQLDGDLNESNRYAQKYMAEIQMLENQGVDVNEFEQMNVFHQRGFK